MVSLQPPVRTSRKRALNLKPVVRVGEEKDSPGYWSPSYRAKVVAHD